MQQVSARIRGRILPLAGGLLLSVCAHAGERVVAVGDLHGDLAGALEVLHLAGLVDGDAHWSGGTTTLVQTGDTTDRGPDSKGVMDLLRRLEGEARAAGGRVVCLLGNHEVMNLQGDWRYVSAGDLEAFGGREARKRALALDGAYGSWLAGLDLATQVGDAVFVHGGLLPAWAALGLDALNEQAHATLRGGPPWAHQGGPPGIFGSEGPVWSRFLVQQPEATACDTLDRSLDSLGARRMVVGHTTQRTGRIQTRCDGRLYAIDVGIASHYGAHRAAWEAVGGDARALYPTGPVDLEDPP